MPLSVECFTISQAPLCQLCPGGRETSLTSGKKNLQSCRWLQLSCLQQLMQPKLRQPRQLGSLGSHGSSSSHGSRGDVAAASAVAAVASAAAAGVQHRRTITCGIARACVPIQNQFHDGSHRHWTRFWTIIIHTHAPPSPTQRCACLAQPPFNRESLEASLGSA